MCGISGLFLIDKERTEKDYQNLRVLTMNLILRTMVRGEQATGIAVINKDRHYVFKSPMDAISFVTTTGFAKALSAIGEDTVAVLCHNRLATQGSVTKNCNNHPLISGNIIGIHNGTISNDKELTTDFKLERKAEVDSEAMFSIMDKYKKEDKPVDDALKEVEGHMAIAWLDLTDKTKAFLAKNDTYMSICSWIGLGKMNAFAFASRDLDIEKSLESIGWHGRTNTMADNELIEFDLKTGKYDSRKFTTKDRYASYSKNYHTEFPLTYLVTKSPIHGNCKTIKTNQEELVYQKDLCTLLKCAFGDAELKIAILADKKYIYIDCYPKLGFVQKKNKSGYPYYVIKNKGTLITKAVKIANELERSWNTSTRWSIKDMTIVYDEMGRILKDVKEEKALDCVIKKSRCEEYDDYYTNQWA